MQGAWKQGNGAGEYVRGGGRGWVARLSKEEGGRQQLCEVGQTEWWGLGTRASQRGEGGEGTSLVAMATNELRKGGERVRRVSEKSYVGLLPTTTSLLSTQARCL